MQPTSRTSPRRLEALILDETYRLELEVWQLYQSASQRLDDADAARAAQQFAGDHHQHLIALRTRLALLGANVGAVGPASSLRGAGQRLLSRVGPLRAVLAALERQERALMDHYRTVDLAPLGRASRALMQHALCDEKVHQAWLRGRVAHVAPQTAVPVPVLAHMSTRHWAHARL